MTVWLNVWHHSDDWPTPVVLQPTARRSRAGSPLTAFGSKVQLSGSPTPECSQHFPMPALPNAGAGALAGALVGEAVGAGVGAAVGDPVGAAVVARVGAEV